MANLEPKDLVTIHACERFASRIMGLEIEQGQLSFDQIKKLTEKIFTIASSCHSNMFKIGKGHFKCNEHECIIVVEDGVIVTIKHLEKEKNPDFTGGIEKSGSKKKKLQWKRGGGKNGDLNGNNSRSKYPVGNGNRYDKKSRRKSLKEF